MLNEDEAPLRPSKADRAHALVKGAIAGAVPIPFVGGVVGGLAAEIFGMVLAAPLEQRREAWMASVSERLTDLEARDNIRLDQLAANPAFTSVLLLATQAALRSRHEEKTRLLRVAVEKSALGIDVAEDLQLLFVRYVDELTPAHVRLLQAFLAK